MRSERKQSALWKHDLAAFLYLSYDQRAGKTILFHVTGVDFTQEKFYTR